MKSKFIRTFLIGAVLSVSGLANAAIIDNGTYTTVDGLDWLDFTSTTNMSQTTALATFASDGWRTANLVEMQSLMDTMFGTQFTTGVHSSWIDVGSAGASDKSQFAALFGDTNPRGGVLSLATVQDVGLVGFNTNRRYGGCTFCSFSTASASSLRGIALVRSEVPEPSTLAILALGMIGLASRRFQKHS
jgi:hypothetical protein